MACKDCECFVFELLCVEKKRDIYSKSLEFADSCDSCTCNSDLDRWSDIEGFSQATMIPIARYDILFPASQVDQEHNYARDLIKYISQSKMGNQLANQARVFESQGKSPSYCSSNISCDLLYDTDWSYRLRFESLCQDNIERDPCFGTSACLCDNGYFRVTEQMPDEVPDSFTGNVDILTQYQQ